MRKLGVFNFVSLNGFYKGVQGDISWARHGDPEDHDFAVESSRSGSTVIFGRVTYQMMAWYWPSQQALQNDPVMAKQMNDSEKIVFSKTLEKAEWNNTTLVKGDLIEEIKKLKQGDGNDLVILGSGSIVTQLAEQGLIDSYQFMVHPVALGDGTSTFKGLAHNLSLKLTSTRAFKSGTVLLTYEPA